MSQRRKNLDPFECDRVRIQSGGVTSDEVTDSVAGTGQVGGGELLPAGHRANLPTGRRLNHLAEAACIRLRSAIGGFNFSTIFVGVRPDRAATTHTR
jgi:hypothetical protein